MANEDTSTKSRNEKDDSINSSQDKSKGTLGEPFNYDDILEHIGQMGKYQLYTFLWLCLPVFFPGIIVMSYTFTGAIPNYRCYVENCDSDSSSQFSPIWLNNTVPWNDDNTPDQCKRYNYTWTNLEECQTIEAPIDSEMMCDRWVYDKSQFQSTIVTDFDLTCDDEWKQTFASTVYMFGMLIGAATLGNIADAIGRKLAFTLNIFFVAVVTTGLAFSQNFVTFCVIRFFCGVGAIGYFLIIFVWGVEAVGKKYRVVCGFIYQLIFTVGNALLGLVAYYVRDWKTLQLIVSVPMFTFVAFYWIVPESIRWLVTKKRYSEAHFLILKAAKMNNKSVPNYLITIPDDIKKEDCSKEIKDTTAHTKADNSQTDGSQKEELVKSSFKSESIIDVFRSPILLKRLIIMFLAWIAAVMGYYGITFSATNLSDNFYLNYELAMVVEIPAYIGGIFVMDKLGRRPTLSGGLIISGIACLITGLVPEDPPVIRITFSMFGKLFISCVLATVYSYTSDLFPTPARSAAVGLCSTSGRIGGILAPIIANAGRKFDPALPFIIFAGVNISVGILCLLLPETKKIALPATVQEAVDMEKYTFSCLQCRKNKNEESPFDLPESLP